MDHNNDQRDRPGETVVTIDGDAPAVEGYKTGGIPFSCYLSVLLSVFLTASYCWAAWWLSGFFWVLPGMDQDRVMSMLSLVLIAPISKNIWLIALHWQLAALFVLLLNMWWTVRLAGSKATSPNYLLPLACQTAWILGCLLLHLVGILASVVTIGHVLE
jgi:hypothetical protein